MCQSIINLLLKVEGLNRGISLSLYNLKRLVSIAHALWRRITLLLVMLDLNPTKVEMKMSNFILEDGGCIERMI